MVDTLPNGFLLLSNLSQDGQMDGHFALVFFRLLMVFQPQEW